MKWHYPESKITNKFSKFITTHLYTSISISYIIGKSSKNSIIFHLPGKKNSSDLEAIYEAIHKAKQPTNKNPNVIKIRS